MVCYLLHLSDCLLTDRRGTEDRGFVDLWICGFVDLWIYLSVLWNVDSVSHKSPFSLTRLKIKEDISTHILLAVELWPEHVRKNSRTSSLLM